MTKPTPAKIEAALNAARTVVHEYLSPGSIGSRVEAAIYELRAALTAAAEVGPVSNLIDDPNSASGKRIAEAGEPERLRRPKLLFDPAGVGLPVDLMIKDAVDAAIAATIERCAQVADAEPEAPGEMPPEFHLIPIEDAIRAAIRATKKEIAAAIRALKDKP